MSVIRIMVLFGSGVVTHGTYGSFTEKTSLVGIVQVGQVKSGVPHLTAICKAREYSDPLTRNIESLVETSTETSPSLGLELVMVR